MALIYHFRPVTPNIGNDLTVFALQTLVRDVAPDPVDFVAVPAAGVSAAIKSGGLTRQIVHDVNHLGTGVLVGPGNLFENNGLEVDPVACGALRKPRIVCGVSWGRIFDDRGILQRRTDEMPSDRVAAVCRGASAVLARDEPTRVHLASLGIRDAIVAGCPILALDVDRLRLPEPDPRVAGGAIISVRHPSLMNISPRLQGRVHADVRRLIDGLRSMGHSRLALLCHDPRDLRFAAAYSDVPLLYTEDPNCFLGWLRDAALSVTFRLHSYLPCAIVGTPSVHLSYDERAIALIETAGLTACDINYVRAADPVCAALEVASEPDKVARIAACARSQWSPLREALQSGLSKWMQDMEPES